MQASTKKDGKELQYIVTGAFTDDKMREVLDKFIKKFICCKKCTFPELIMKSVDGRIVGDCKSCGTIQQLDNKHKIAPTLIKELRPSDDLRDKQANKNLKDADKNKPRGDAKKRRKKLVLADPELKAFRDRLISEDYPLDPSHVAIRELLDAYKQSYANIPGDKKKRLGVEKAYKNLKTLKVPRQKQALFGLLLFNAVFSKNIGNQLNDKVTPKFLLRAYEVRPYHPREATEARCAPSK